MRLNRFCASVAGTFSVLNSGLVAGVDLELLVWRLLVLAGDLDVITLDDVVLLDFLLGCPQHGLLRSRKQLVRRFLELAGVSGDDELLSSGFPAVLGAEGETTVNLLVFSLNSRALS